MPPHLNSSHTEPYFWEPVSVTLDREQRLYVLETNRHRVQIYQKTVVEHLSTKTRLVKARFGVLNG